MCDYIERQLRCGHVKLIVHAWCPNYRRTEVKCPPNIVHWEYWSERICGDCQPPQRLAPEWESMIKRNKTCI
ncbi:hypothetical protein VUR80DRAFT_8408 [Thermomyces stellatus]